MKKEELAGYVRAYVVATFGRKVLDAVTEQCHGVKCTSKGDIHSFVVDLMDKNKNQSLMNELAKIDIADAKKDPTLCDGIAVFEIGKGEEIKLYNAVKQQIIDDVLSEAERHTDHDSKKENRFGVRVKGIVVEYFGQNALPHTVGIKLQQEVNQALRGSQYSHLAEFSNLR